MKNFIKIFIILVISLLATPSISINAQETLPSSYIFHLYFDSGNLILDRDYPEIFEIVDESYEFPDPDTLGSLRYRGEINSFNGESIEIFYFDPILDRDDSTISSDEFKKGKITLFAPYIFKAKTVNFYDPNEKLLLSVSVAASALCNENNLCDSGESTLTCPSDCKVVVDNKIQNKKNQSKNIRNSLVYFGVGAVVIIGGIWLLHRLKRNSQGPSSNI